MYNLSEQNKTDITVHETEKYKLCLLLGHSLRSLWVKPFRDTDNMVAGNGLPTEPHPESQV